MLCCSITFCSLIKELEQIWKDLANKYGTKMAVTPLYITAVMPASLLLLHVALYSFLERKSSRPMVSTVNHMKLAHDVIFG